MSFCINMPVRLYTGEGVVRQNSAEFGRYGKRCLLVTGKSSAKLSGALADVTAVLEAQGVAWELFDKVGQNPLLSVCHAGGQAAAAFGADFVVGIGGGSPLDAAKAVAAFGGNPQMAPLALYEPWQNPALPFLLVGTTAGTGSEVTRFSIMTVDETGCKRSWGNEQSYAKAAFGDPRYTESLSVDFTMSTGLDAVSHALEGYFSTEADAVSDLFAIEALRLLLPTLKDAWVSSQPPNPQMRARLYDGSIYAGMTLNRCGTTFCHLFGYPLSEQQAVPHGYACALFLPAYLEWCVPLMPQKAQRLFRAIGMYAAELSDQIAMMTPTDYTPLSDSELEALMARCKDSTNIARTPGAFSTEEQRVVATRILQKR